MICIEAPLPYGMRVEKVKKRHATESTKGKEENNLGNESNEIKGDIHIAVKYKVLFNDKHL